MMPRLDGAGLVRELRARPQTQAIPIIMLSARSDETARIEGLQLGADDYVTKPFSPRELIARVDAGLQMARLRQNLIEVERTARTALRASNEELQQFASVVSHDLQEPLRMVTSYLQLLKNRYAARLDDDAIQFIGFAVDGVERMRALITDLLAYSRIERGYSQMEMIDMQAALNKALAMLSLQVGDSGAIITQTPLPQITADEGQIIQLFQNLLTNAMKFQPAGSVPRIHIGAEQQDGVWEFSVGDNGIGIEAEYLDRLFVMFRRLHQRSEYPGTGIGLAICKKVVERHHGRIRVESTPGTGTTFFFTLPG
jgi:light-regulated signal transduction histidine kinase (bacteriophytochrome)